MYLVQGAAGPSACRVVGADASALGAGVDVKERGERHGRGNCDGDDREAGRRARRRRDQHRRPLFTACRVDLARPPVTGVNCDRLWRRLAALTRVCAADVGCVTAPHLQSSMADQECPSASSRYQPSAGSALPCSHGSAPTARSTSSPRRSSASASDWVTGSSTRCTARRRRAQCAGSRRMIRAS